MRAACFGVRGAGTTVNESGNNAGPIQLKRLPSIGSSPHLASRTPTKNHSRVMMNDVIPADLPPM